jgi:signal transduction histidine kinase
MRITIPFFSFCLFCCGPQAVAQVWYVDSLEQLLSQKPDLARQIEIRTELARELLRISPDEALQNINALKTLADSTEDQTAQANYYWLMASLSGIQGNHLYSTFLAFQARKRYEQLKDSAGIANTYVALANNYSRQQLHRPAVRYFLMALAVFERMGKNRRAAICMTNLAFSYNKLGNYDSALFFGERSSRINQEGKFLSVLINDYRNLGSSYFLKGDYPQAKKYFEQALALNERIGHNSNTEAVVEALILLGKISLTTGDKAAGFNYLAQAMMLAREYGYLLWWRDALFELSAWHLREGNDKKATDYLLQHAAVIDSLARKQRDEHTKMGDVYLTALQESLQYDQLKKEYALKEKIVRQQRIEIILGVVTLLLLLLLLYYMKLSNRRRRKINQMLNEQKEEIIRKNQELAKLNQTKDKFFSIVAHDLRSPMASLKSFTLLVKSHFDKLSKEELISMIHDLDGSVDNTLRMTENLITWARQQMNLAEPFKEVLNLKDLVNPVCEVYNDAAKLKSITLTANIPDGISVYADRNQAMFIIRNLVNNAVKFTRTGGTVEVQARQGNGSIQLSVQDTGIGMDAEIIKRLFEINGPGRNTGTAGEKGTGLGLVLCQEFINQDNGKIWVESKPGAGSTFHVQWPAKMNL